LNFDWRYVSGGEFVLARSHGKRNTLKPETGASRKINALGSDFYSNFSFISLTILS
jgi:hypothetical protein